jgi:hypothetical protein
MQTHGVSDADVTKRQLGWYLRNCAESAFAEDIKLCSLQRSECRRGMLNREMRMMTTKATSVFSA